MKKAVFILPILIAPFLLSTTSYAESNINVDISNNSSGSKSTVNVKNTVNTNSQSQVDSKTKVKITTNGETKEYVATGDEDINIESSDGNSKVKITNTSSASVKNASDSTISAEKKELNKKKMMEETEMVTKVTPEKEKTLSTFFEKQWNYITKIIFFWRD